MPIVINMKKFILLLLLTQCSFANELSSAHHKTELASLELMAEIKAEMAFHKAELASLELMAEIKAEMAFHKAELASLELMAEIKAEMGVTECVFPEARILNREYHSSLRVILLDYENLLKK